MDRGLFVAASAASNLMDRLSIVSHNLANADTAGFKKIFDRMATFPVENSQATLPEGRAYAVALTPALDARPGPISATSNPLNVAMAPNQYLAISLPGGGEAYTRRGDALTDALGVMRLPTGQALLGDGGEIAIPAGFAGAVAEDGTVWAQDPTNPGNKQEVGRLKVVTGAQISLRDDGFYDIADAVASPAGGRLLSGGYVEKSNVSGIDAMAEMIETSRLYELNTRLVSAFNSMDQKGADLLSGWQ